MALQKLERPRLTVLLLLSKWVMLGGICVGLLGPVALGLPFTAKWWGGKCLLAYGEIWV